MSGIGSWFSENPRQLLYLNCQEPFCAYRKPVLYGMSVVDLHVVFPMSHRVR